MKKKQRGITLILALFLAFLLSTLSLAYVTLMMEDSRGGKSSSRYVTAAETAEWGIQVVLSYMGRGSNWQTIFDPGTMNFVDVLAAGQVNGLSHLKMSPVSQGNDDADPLTNISVKVQADPVDANKLLMTVYEGTGPGTGADSLSMVPINKEYKARVTVEFQPELISGAAYGVGQAARYKLTSSASLFKRADVTAGSLLPDPVAVSVMEAIVRPEQSTDYLLRLQNARSWDFQSSQLGNKHAADKIFIPDDYVATGNVMITGADPAKPAGGELEDWDKNAGNLRFNTPGLNDPDTNPGGKLRFNGILAIAQLANTDRGLNTIHGSNQHVFPGAVSFGNGYVPLPEKQRYLSIDRNGNGIIDGTVGTAGAEQGLMEAVAKATDADHDSSGYLKIDKSLIVKNHQVNPRTKDLSSDKLVENQDYRPGIPEIQVTLKSGGNNPGDEGLIQIDVVDPKNSDPTKRNLNAAIKQSMQAKGIDVSKLQLGTPFKVSELKNGVIYADGGQVVVKSELAGDKTAQKFAGKIQIIAAQDALRRPLPGSVGNNALGKPSDSIYNTVAKEYFDYQTERRKLPQTLSDGSANPDFLAPENFQEPPYGAAALKNKVASLSANLQAKLAQCPPNSPEEAAIQGRIDRLAVGKAQLNSLGGAANSPDALYWPPPNVGVEREGNLVVAGDVLKKDAASVIGLTAENFVLLSDRTRADKAESKVLKIDAVLNSFDHSIQFDWFNTSNNDTLDEAGKSAHETSNKEGFNGKVVLNGSILSPYSDVEGDLKGKGYPDQKFTYDKSLSNFTPPYQPRTLISDYPKDVISVAWIVVSFRDRTSFTVAAPGN